MPVIYKKLEYGEQQGYNDQTNGVFTNGGYNYGINTGRVQIFRFGLIPVPKGSTINSATLYTVQSGKNQTGTAYTFTQSVYIDGVTPSKWLDTSRDEWNTNQRTWSYFGSSSNWAWNQSGASRQFHTHSVKPHLDALLANPGWTLAGGSMTVLLAYSAVSNADNIYLHTYGDAYSPTLVIDYTAPASDGKDTIVNVQENGQFIRNVNNASAFNVSPFSFNQWFGSYTQPNLSAISTYGGNPPAPPGGGNALRVEPAGGGRPMVHNGNPSLEDGEWYNYSAYIYLPSTTPVGMDVNLTCLGDTVLSSPTVSTKGSWQRVNISFIQELNGSNWCTIQGNNSPVWDTTAAFYVANVQLTKGRRVKPYIAGNLSRAGATYGWAGVNVNGFVRAVAPTVTADVQYDKARRRFYDIGWSYSQPDGHALATHDVQVRKVK